jgi:hypothetical protein
MCTYLLYIVTGLSKENDPLLKCHDCNVNMIDVSFFLFTIIEKNLVMKTQNK